MIFYENCLPADDSQETSCLYLLFLKKHQNLKLLSAANIGGALWVKPLLYFSSTGFIGVQCLLKKTGVLYLLEKKQHILDD